MIAPSDVAVVDRQTAYFMHSLMELPSLVTELILMLCGGSVFDVLPEINVRYPSHVMKERLIETLKNMRILLNSADDVVFLTQSCPKRLYQEVIESIEKKCVL
jgi:hypothetical protein